MHEMIHTNMCQYHEQLCNLWACLCACVHASARACLCACCGDTQWQPHSHCFRPAVATTCGIIHKGEKGAFCHSQNCLNQNSFSWFLFLFISFYWRKKKSQSKKRIWIVKMRSSAASTYPLTHIVTVSLVQLLRGRWKFFCRQRCLPGQEVLI